MSTETKKQVIDKGSDGFVAVPSEIVEATSEATIVVCGQCSHAHFKVGKKTLTSVTLNCASCGVTTSVKGPVALARVNKGEVALAVKDSVVRPDPTYKVGSGKKKPSLSEQGYSMLKGRIPTDVKDGPFDLAMLCIRIINTGKANFEEQSWFGSSIEYLCADFLAGVDPGVSALAHEIVDGAEKLADKTRAEGKKEPIVKRRVREYKQKTREEGAQELGIWGGEEKPKRKVKEETPAVVETLGTGATPEPVVDDGDNRVYDDGLLLKCVRDALSAYAMEYKEESGKQLKMLAGVPYGDALKRYEDGGLLVRVVGDERTRDKSGNRPTVYFWLEFEPGDVVLEMDIDYADVFGDAIDGEAELFLTELLPNGYTKMEKKDQWTSPTFCDNREEMKK